jgi:hypothetical protein
LLSFAHLKRNIVTCLHNSMWKNATVRTGDHGASAVLSR